jgi:predicted RNase H-like HicB family nuclease
MRYAIVIEKTPNNYSGFILDVDGLVATGATREEVKQRLEAAVLDHLEGEIVPDSTTTVDYIDIDIVKK